MDEYPQPQPLTGARMWLAGVGLALTNFVVILDTTITNVSVPHIAGGLAVSPSQGAWTITSYAVAEAITVPLSGWLSARFGAMRTLVWALLGFGLFSLLCGMARTIEVLVLFRVLQGLCGGPMMPMTQTLLLRVFPPEKMGTANALWAVTAVSAPILGPLAGGVISDNFDWPWIFYINLPVVVLGYGIITSLLGGFETPTRQERVDLIGLVLLVLFAGSLQLMLDLGREHDWFASKLILSLGIIAVVAFAAFVVWELTDPNPVVDLRILRHRSLAVGLVVVAGGYSALMAMLVVMPLWLQTVMDYTASDAGHVMAMQGVLAVAFSPLAAVLLQKYDMRPLITFGLGITVVAALLRMGWTTDAGFWSFAGVLLLQGAALPFFFIGVMTLSMVHVPQAEIAGAAGLLNSLRTIAGAAGMALSIAIWDHGTQVSRAEMVGGLHGVDGVTVPVPGAEGAGAAVIERLVEAQAATIGAWSVYAGAIALTLAAALLVWAMPRVVGTAQVSAGH